PQTSSSTGTTEKTTPIAGTQEENLNSTITTTSKGTTLSNSMQAGNAVHSSQAMTTTVSEKSAVTVSPRTLDKISKNVKEPSPMTMSTVIYTTLLTITTLGTTVLGTTVSGTQEGKTTGTLPPLTSAPMSQEHQSTATQIPSYPVESASSVATAAAQSPKTMAAHSTALTPSSSGTTKTSITGTSQAFPKHTQSSSPGTEACALDEYAESSGVCRCNKSYYTHSELSRESVSLHCLPQKIEVLLSNCFLETHHWILAKGAFSGCSSVSRIDQGLRVQVFTLKKKEGTCGLHLSTNNSHALYSLEVQLLHVLLGFIETTSSRLSFSCVYPLVVNVSQTQPYPVVTFPYSVIHVPGTGDTIIILGIFTDPQLSAPLENRTAPLGKPLFVVLRATSSDPDRFALVANEVFASTNISRMGAVKATYHFVNESCPVSNRLLQGLRANGDSLEVTLAFNLFRFLTSDTLYLHGRVTLCDKRAGQPCQPTCPKNPPGREQAWQIRASESLERGDSWVVFGPIRISESNASSSRSSAAGTWIAVFLLMLIGWILG
uniref:ZP domain-containing protein n=1 Tax=Otolemur garnettii TaxID=30611 RepID=H0XRL3_OTOGA